MTDYRGTFTLLAADPNIPDPPCCKCGRRPAYRLCDWRIAGSGYRTCDRPLCDVCAARLEPGKDFCPVHVERWNERHALVRPSALSPESVK